MKQLYGGLFVLPAEQYRHEFIELLKQNFVRVHIDHLYSEFMTCAVCLQRREHVIAQMAVTARI
ncbi:hypothetical protein BH11PSE11_BH11PSE11_23290 [soil metagenome]